ncbi:MAG: hypothetical protein ABI024_11860, partial [Vicinamibacterales bacterium]
MLTLDLGDQRSVEFYQHAESLTLVQHAPLDTDLPVTKLGLEEASFPEVYAALRPGEPVPEVLVNAEARIRAVQAQQGEEESASLRKPADEVSDVTAKLTRVEFLSKCTNEWNRNCPYNRACNTNLNDVWINEFLSAKSGVARFHLQNRIGTHAMWIDAYTSGNFTEGFWADVGQLTAVTRKGP